MTFERSKHRQATLMFVGSLLVALAVGVGDAPAAAPRPDLKPQSVTFKPASAAPGAAVTIRATVKNGGKANAGASKTEALLSLDRKLSKSDFSIKRVSTAKLKSGKGVKVAIAGNVPLAVPNGSYFVIVCSDAAKKVKESNEANGCATSKSAIVIAAPVSPPTVTPPAPPIPQSGPVGGAASLCGGASKPIMNGHVPDGYHLTVSATPLSFNGGGVQAEYVYPEDVPQANSLVYTLTNDGTAATPLIRTDPLSCHVINPTGFPSNRGGLNDHLQPNPDLGGTQDCYDIVLDPGESCKGELYIDRAQAAGTFAGVLRVQKVTLPNADLAVFPVESEVYSRPFITFTGVDGGIPGSSVPVQEHDVWLEAENIGTTGGIPAYVLEGNDSGKYGLQSIDDPPFGYTRCQNVPLMPGGKCVIQLAFCSSTAGLWVANLRAYGTLQNGSTDLTAPWSGINEYSVNVSGPPDPGSCSI